jgi:hypothetical protein
MAIKITKRDASEKKVIDEASTAKMKRFIKKEKEAEPPKEEPFPTTEEAGEENPEEFEFNLESVVPSGSTDELENLNQELDNLKESLIEYISRENEKLSKKIDEASLGLIEYFKPIKEMLFNLSQPAAVSPPTLRTAKVIDTTATNPDSSLRRRVLAFMMKRKEVLAANNFPDGGATLDEIITGLKPDNVPGTDPASKKAAVFNALNMEPQIEKLSRGKYTVK